MLQTNKDTRSDFLHLYAIHAYHICITPVFRNIKGRLILTEKEEDTKFTLSERYRNMSMQQKYEIGKSAIFFTKGRDASIRAPKCSLGNTPLRMNCE